MCHPALVWVGSQSPKSPVSVTQAPEWRGRTTQEEKECILQDMNRVYAFCAFAFSCFIAQLSFVLKKMPSQTCAIDFLWISGVLRPLMDLTSLGSLGCSAVCLAVVFISKEAVREGPVGWGLLSPRAPLMLGAGAYPQCFLIYLIQCGPLSPTALKAKSFFRQLELVPWSSGSRGSKKKKLTICTQPRGNLRVLVGK